MHCIGCVQVLAVGFKPAMMCLCMSSAWWGERWLAGEHLGISATKSTMLPFPVMDRWFVPAPSGSHRVNYKRNAPTTTKRRSNVPQHLTGHAMQCVIYKRTSTLAPITCHYHRSNRFLVAFLGWISCCCGDNLSSEIGILSTAPPVLLTSLRPVPAGTDGAVSLLGMWHVC